MTRKNKGVKIMAFLALFGIIIGIVGTALLVIFGGQNPHEKQGLTQEEYMKLQELINSQTGIVVETATGETNTLTGETK